MSENATISNAARMMSEAGSTAAPAVRASADADLAGPTPCGDWDLRTLVRHFVGTSGAFVRAGQVKALDPDDPWGSNAVLDESDWADQLADQVAAAGEAWSRPEAWTGSVEGAQMPATAVGELGLIELMLHGWDVARAGGQSLEVSDELGAEVLRCLEPTLQQGRQFEVYGPPVIVPPDASAFARALGLSGRDPEWRP
ncbi:MAG TPA: TIGR03086 family metal-binding protein [Propionibacteriaceae bacterium]|nr:TIGR03086 family metal-binding protein [Propionibacteriaceae bacterium]